MLPFSYSINLYMGQFVFGKLTAEEIGDDVKSSGSVCAYML